MIVINEDEIYKVFVSKVPYARIWSKVKAVKDIYEVGDPVTLSIAKYDYGFYITEEFWVKFYQ